MFIDGKVNSYEDTNDGSIRMEDIEQLVKQKQWLAQDRFDFSPNKGCKVGENIFDRYKFQVCKFTLFEYLLTHLDNSDLCKAFDWFESNRLRSMFKQHFHKSEPEPEYATTNIVYQYLDCLLCEREGGHIGRDIPSIRSELAWYGRSFPEISSEHLITEFEKSGITLDQN